MIMQKVWRKTSIKTSVHDIRKNGSRLLWKQLKFCADLFRKSILPFPEKHAPFLEKDYRQVRSAVFERFFLCRLSKRIRIVSYLYT